MALLNGSPDQPQRGMGDDGGLLLERSRGRRSRRPAASPTRPTRGANLAHGAVVLDSALLVFREGLEAILVLAAFTASFVGANRASPPAGRRRRGARARSPRWRRGSSRSWVIGALGGPGLDVQAATGLIAVAVLLVVMNWFFHKVYWTGWISAHNRRRRALLGEPAGGARCSASRSSASPPSTARASRSCSSCRTSGSRRARAPCSRASAIGARADRRSSGSRPSRPAPPAVPADARRHRRPARLRAARDGRRERPGAAARRLAADHAARRRRSRAGVGLWFAAFPTVEALTAQLLAARS